MKRKRRRLKREKRYCFPINTVHNNYDKMSGSHAIIRKLYGHLVNDKEN